jgi:VWFA-related protein
MVVSSIPRLPANQRTTVRDIPEILSIREADKFRRSISFGSDSVSSRPTTGATRLHPPGGFCGDTARIIAQMTGAGANRMESARRRSAATIVGWVAACVLLVAQEPQAPPTFRTTTNIVRVDATVLDRNGDPVPSLTAEDFEIREDGVLQTISSFRFVRADGRATDDRSLPIRSQSHAASEAERDDVRAFVILWDEYHIGEFQAAYRAREALEDAVLTVFGETDLVALIDPLTSVADIEFTRDRRAMADRVRKLKGRRGVYIPRSPLEEAQMRAASTFPGGVEGIRSAVSADAIKAAAIHLRTLGEGHKTLIVIAEGFTPIREGRDLAVRSVPGERRGSDDPALDLVRVANDSNVSIQVIDPMGLGMGTRPNFFLQTITADTGGELYRTNDLKKPFINAVKAASAAYLLGYAREGPEDGRFHQIKVSVKPRGLSVRARSGYWAPSGAEIERARAAAEAAVLPDDVASAFASLPQAGSPRQVDIFAGTRPVGDGRLQVTLAWSRRSNDPRNAPARVTVTASGDAVAYEGDVKPDGTVFETDAARLQFAFTVLSADGDVLDREARTHDASQLFGASLAFATPTVYRTGTVAQLRAMQEAAPAVPVAAGREFGRTDRVFVRASLAGPSSSTAAVTARLIDRRGVTRASLPATRVGSEDTWQVELPIGSIGAGEYAVAYDAEGGEQRATTMVAFRVRR